MEQQFYIKMQVSYYINYITPEFHEDRIVEFYEGMPDHNKMREEILKKHKSLDQTNLDIIKITKYRKLN